MPVEAPPPAEINDLFAFCNHLAWQVGGPVLLHDAGFGVVAYSTLQQPIDESRRAIILRREVPDNEVENESTSIAFERFEAGDESFEIAPYHGIQTRRIVAPVHVMGVRVGAIWVAESAGPLHPDAHEIVRGASKQAALLFHLQVDARKRETEVFTRLLLEGGTEEELLAQYLGVPVRARSCVVAVWHGGSGDTPRQVPQVARAILEKHSLAYLALPTDDCLYLTTYDKAAEPDFSERVKRAAAEISSADDRLRVGIGRIPAHLADVPKSRRDADTVVAYLRHNPGPRVASLDSIQPDVTLMRVLEILDSQVEAVRGPLSELTGLSDEDREDALSTLDAYFDFAGNATEAARSLCIHPNTFRYRLAKVVDLLGIDLDNRNARLLLELDLLRHRYGRSRGA